MANIILFDSEERAHLLPLTYTRPVGEIRVGILTIKEKWMAAMSGEVSYITQDYLAEKYPLEYGAENYVINGSVLPSPQLLRLIQQMEYNDAFLLNEELIAAKLDERQFERLIHDKDVPDLKGIDLGNTEILKINRLWDLFQINDRAIKADFEGLTKGRKSEPIHTSNTIIGKEQIFIENGAQVHGAFLNASKGPIYIGKNTEIMEGAMIRGSFALLDNAIVKMGAKIYGATTVGKYAKAGGEIKNSIIGDYSNKGHDGFLGDSVLGRWCNIGADSNNSNLKNNYAEVKLWNYPSGRFVKTGTQFCGLILGDHSKCAINTVFNTGTVVGVGANIIGEGFPRNFLPSFTWRTHAGFQTYQTDKAFETMALVMARRDEDFTTEDRLIMIRVFEDTARYRSWEHDKKDA